MRAVLRDVWRRVWLRGSQFSGKYDQLDHLYMTEDPWELESARERHRFARTNDILRDRFGHPASILEIGCGEGAQTRMLLELGADVTGVDVSARAIRRAAAALPEVRFAVGRGEDVAGLFAGERFDVVLACEVLYYAAAPEAVIAAMQTLTDQLLVTVYAGRLAPLAALLAGDGWADAGIITFEDTVWHCRTWSRSECTRTATS
jgi:2-polyprenyl-3-methyl-5-hydroxy-6-metoxy-1,4-benzoquinol methylase